MNFPGPATVFELAGRIARKEYDLKMLSCRGGLVSSSSKVMVQTLAFDEAEAAFDTLIAVGGEGHHNAMDCTCLRKFLCDNMNETRHMCSVCVGAFVLASPGLLHGPRGTTHGQHAQTFSRLFLDVKLEPDVMKDQWHTLATHCFVP